MAKSKRQKYKLSFVGNNSTEVTGSMNLVTLEEETYLVDCGLIQSSSLKDDFIRNSKLPKEIKPKKLNAVFITHSHIDHVGSLPLLVKNGYQGDIFVPLGSRNLIKKLLIDSCYIMERNAEMLSKQPHYCMQDVYGVLNKIEELDFNLEYQITEKMGVQLYHAGHVLKSAQVMLYLNKSCGNIKKILFTGDIGTEKHGKPQWCEPIQKITKADVVVGECTYNYSARSKVSHTRDKDREKMKTVIRDTASMGGKVLIPSFSFNRTQTILSELYEMYHDTDFPYQIVIDSPLSVSLTTLYPTLLDMEKKEKFEKMLRWENLLLCKDHKVHERLLNHGRPLIILASAGMLDFGRSNSWIKKLISGKTNSVLFVGYASPTSIAGKIKDPKVKQIKIGKEIYKNKCDIFNLHSFSSHMQYDELLDYYSNIHAEKICLVHGEQSGKIEFAKTLQNLIREKNSTTKVLAISEEQVVYY